jgi:hypothetical protein
MSPDRRLTLGALYHEMRAGVGDGGRFRVVVEFQQLSHRTGGVDAAGAPASLVLETLVEYAEGVLDRAQVALHGSGPPQRIMMARHGDAYAYSLDRGERWGPLAAHPHLFDLEEFEGQLEQISVLDATIDALDGSESDGEGVGVGPGDGGRAMAAEQRVDALDVSLDRAGFLRLLQIFSADVDAGAETPRLHAYSVSLEAAADVALHYWWSLLDDLSAPPPASMIRCAVSIRVAALAEAAPSDVRMDPALPTLSDLDSVWAAAHRGASRAANEFPPG